MPWMACIPNNSSTSLQHWHLARLWVDPLPLSLSCVMQKKTVLKKTDMHNPGGKKPARLWIVLALPAVPSFANFSQPGFCLAGFLFSLHFYYTNCTLYYHCLIHYQIWECKKMLCVCYLIAWGSSARGRCNSFRQVLSDMFTLCLKVSLSFSYL